MVLPQPGPLSREVLRKAAIVTDAHKRKVTGEVRLNTGRPWKWKKTVVKTLYCSEHDGVGSPEEGRACKQRW